jgi:hypothetical protein
MREVEVRLGGELRNLKEAVKRWKETVAVEVVSEVRNGTAPKKAEGESDGRVKVVIFTDLNGRDMGPDNIKAHIPIHQRDKVDIRVEVVYTLMEAYDRLGCGGLKVEGE